LYFLELTLLYCYLEHQSKQTFKCPKKTQVQMMFYCLKGGLTVPMEKTQKLKAFNNYQCLMLIKGYTGRSMIQPQPCYTAIWNTNRNPRSTLWQKQRVDCTSSCVAQIIYLSSRKYNRILC
jgi:hypothetical protein